MTVLRYRITSPTLALFIEDDHHVARIIPLGSVIKVDSRDLDGQKFVTVTWNGRKVMMFAQDLLSRAVAVSRESKEPPEQQ